MSTERPTFSRDFELREGQLEAAVIVPIKNIDEALENCYRFVNEFVCPIEREVLPFLQLRLSSTGEEPAEFRACYQAYPQERLDNIRKFNGENSPWAITTEGWPAFAAWMQDNKQQLIKPKKYEDGLRHWMSVCFARDQVRTGKMVEAAPAVDAELKDQ